MATNPPAMQYSKGNNPNQPTQRKQARKAKKLTKRKTLTHRNNRHETTTTSSRPIKQGTRAQKTKPQQHRQPNNIGRPPRGYGCCLISLINWGSFWVYWTLCFGR